MLTDWQHAIVNTVKMLEVLHCKDLILLWKTTENTYTPISTFWKNLYFSVFPVKNRKGGSVGGGRGNLKHSTPVFQVMYVRKQNDWKRCWSSYVAAVLLQIRMWRLYTLPMLWTWEVGLVPVRAGLCGFCYVLSERRKELSLVLGWISLRSAISLPEVLTEHWLSRDWTQMSISQERNEVSLMLQFV